jgi:hypothetical protein
VEFATGQWLKSIYGSGERLQVFGTVFAWWPVQYHLFDATYTAEPSTDQIGSWTAENHWWAMGELLRRFDDFVQKGNFALFVDGPKQAIHTALTFGIPVDDPHWGDMARHVSDKYGRIYTNGPFAIYAGWPR